MKYLLDTCVISEIIKKRPDEKVLTWLQQQDEDDLYLSVLTLGEIEKWIEKAVDITRKSRLILWVNNDLKQRFQERLIPVDLRIANQWGRVQGRAELIGKPMPSIDGLIAVSALVYECVMVTRNTTDMEQSGVVLFNPWL